MADLRRTIDNISNLPTLPDVVMKINQLVRDPNTSAADINEVISRDMSFSAKILKLVNSPFYGFPRRITSITHAVVILGFNAIRNLALSAFMFEAFDKRTKVFDLHAFWRHSICTGIAAQVIARRARFEAIDDSFMAGLLHDIGKAVMNQFMPDEFEQVIKYVKKQDCLFLEAENHLLDFTHGDVGGLLMEKWNLPLAMVEVVQHHHTPSESELEQPICPIVHLADIFVRALCLGFGGDSRIPRIDASAYERLGFSDEDIDPLADQILTEIRRAGAFFELT